MLVISGALFLNQNTLRITLWNCNWNPEWMENRWTYSLDWPYSASNCWNSVHCSQWRLSFSWCLREYEADKRRREAHIVLTFESPWLFSDRCEKFSFYSVFDCFHRSFLLVSEHWLCVRICVAWKEKLVQLPATWRINYAESFICTQLVPGPLLL